MPSGPGAVDTRMRSPSVRWRSTAAVRSIAAASSRTLIASTARGRRRPPSDRQDRNRPRTGASDAGEHSSGDLQAFGTSVRMRSGSRTAVGQQCVDFAAFRAHHAGTCRLPPELVIDGRIHSSNRQHDLADMGARFHAGMGGRSLRQREGRVHDRLHLAGRDQRQHVLLDRRARSRPCRRPSRARSVEPVWVSRLSMMRRKSTVAFGRALEGDLHHAPFDRGRLVVALDVVAAHHVEDNIGALAAGRGLGGGDEVFGLIVNGDVGAELAAGLAFLRRAGGGDHARAERLARAGSRRCRCRTSRHAPAASRRP